MLAGKKIWVITPELKGIESYDPKTNKWYNDLIYTNQDGISLYPFDFTKRTKG